MYTAYLVFTVSAETGRIVGVGIFGEPCPTTIGPYMRMEARGWSPNRADTYAAARAGMMSRAEIVATRWKCEPIQNALLALAKTGSPQMVEWPGE